MTTRKFFVAVPVLLVLTGLAVYDYGYLRVQAGLAAMREEEAAGTKSLGKYVDFVTRGPEMEQRLTMLKEARKAEDSKIIEGQTVPVAAAMLQAIVKGLVTGRGGSMTSERVEKPEDLGKFKLITVSIDATVPDARTLQDVLYAIETQTPYLVVRELEARVRDMREPRELGIRLRVSALTVGK